MDAYINISTHAPRTGSDERRKRYPTQEQEFQPTLPARGATEAATVRPY